ncbi:MAG: bifunctional [glutamate--ammonia ligase]-adenylyl-L-tyrosine phosphorylase/[glutamate--ammonia-ligase] adenylyltransferase [Deltaproteobacteria bacterium]|nr:bifunctional [glutamate--ammonia ligase]-adenylyl-L-tyrosine phosphorylase/[glutamate--ammonia-ligase] adenylyltransferase [Deltaproteobacteria bacterium]
MTVPSPREALLAAAVEDPERLLARFAALWPEGNAPAPARAALLDAADPALAVAALGRLRDAEPAATAAVQGDPELARHLVTVLGASPLVARLLLADAGSWMEVLARAAAATPIGTLVPAPVLPPAAPLDELAHALRGLKRRRVLRIAVRDLLRLANLEQTTAALTALAEDALETAIVVVRGGLVADYGDVLDGDAPVGFVVLGMGKLGGVELNFSSDIDLVYLYGRDGIESTGGLRGHLSAREFFTRLAEGVTRALHQGTEDGFVFRVDLRLRPEGANGPIVNSIANALTYYESWGQTWERAALLKACPIAGDRAVGERFLRDLTPFVYRRYLDYATIEDIKEMKARVEGALAAGRSKGVNVKLGRGGIREVEFVIQSLQLVHAGKDERIRERGSLSALRRLAEHRYLDAEEGERLAAAYRFLREVEHKIQLVEERQTHVIPAGDAELHLARRLGYGWEDPTSAVARFRDDCRRHMETVHASFATLFYSSREAIGRVADPRLTAVLAELEDADATRARLRGLGFHAVDEALADLRLLRDGAPTSRSTPRRRQLLLEVAPALLGEIVQAPDPDLALHNMASFLAAIGARSSFLSLLAENPATLRTLVRLFGSSEFLSQVLIRHPETLDNLVRANLVRIEIAKVDMAAELASMLAAAESYEDRLDVLRRFRNEHFLRIGTNDLMGLLPFHALSSQLSDLADVCLEATWRVAERETLERYGLATSPGTFTVVGMGKLGSRELTYHSDLDLIFVYVPAAEGPEHVAVHEYFTRLAQVMLTTLQVPTREGRVYKIDTRLRPSGNKGPLVSSLEAFSRYHAGSSQLWERQALIKARAVTGEPPLMCEVESIIERFVYARPLDDAEVAEIHRLRMRMERELAGSELHGFNVKTGRGGLVDIEFLTQMLQLRHGATVPSVRRRATRHALAALADAGLLPRADATVLAESYAFLRTLTNRLRIERDQPVEALEREGARLPALARRLGYEGPSDEIGRRLLEDYERHRERVRALYTHWFGVDGDAARSPIDDPASRAPSN